MLGYSALRTLTLGAVLVCSLGSIARPAALVGQTLHLPMTATVAPALDQVRNAYRRPDMIPFPSENPYTPAKALLGRLL
jgi:cytochrome c peroxidase